MCLAQGHNTVTPVRLKPLAPRSRVKHSTTEPLCSLSFRSSQFSLHNMSVTCDFQQCGVLTSLDSDQPERPPFKLRNSKWSPSIIETGNSVPLNRKKRKTAWQAVSFYLHLRFIISSWATNQIKVHCQGIHFNVVYLYCILCIDIALFTHFSLLGTGWKVLLP